MGFANSWWAVWLSEASLEIPWMVDRRWFVQDSACNYYIPISVCSTWYSDYIGLYALVLDPYFCRSLSAGWFCSRHYCLSILLPCEEKKLALSFTMHMSWLFVWPVAYSLTGWALHICKRSWTESLRVPFSSGCSMTLCPCFSLSL